MTYMIYGATGFTGKLALRLATEAGEKPVIAGRDAKKLALIAHQYDVPWVVFSLDDHPKMVDALKKVNAVFHAAGPYSATSAAMVEACLDVGCHYIDVTAENEVLNALRVKNREAKAANVMLLPGAGAGGGPTDCLAAYLKQKLPDATELNFYGGSLEVPTRGTAKSAMEAVYRPTQVRRDGRLVDLKEDLQTKVVIEGRERLCITVPLCDVLIAYWSTAIPNITTYVENAGVVQRMTGMPNWMKRFLGTRAGQRMMRYYIDKQPEGPTQEQLARGSYKNMAEVKNAAGKKVSAMACGPEGYIVTALSALSATRRAAKGEAVPGYQTVSSAYGAGFFSALPGCCIKDGN